MTTGPIATLRAGFQVLGRAWLSIAAVLAVTSLGLALVGLLAMSALSGLAWAQRSIVIGTDGGLTLRGAVVLFVEVGVPFLVVALFAFAVNLGALAKISDDALAGRPARVDVALGRGVRRAPALVAVCLLGGLGATALVTLSPLFVAAGLLGLIGWPIVSLARRWKPELRWPTPRRSLRRAVPLLEPVTIIVRWGLAVPAATLECNGGRAALRRSRAIVPPRWGPVAASLVALAGFYLTVSIGFDAVHGAALPFAVVLVVAILVQLVISSVPVAGVTFLYRNAAPDVPEHLVVTDPTPPRRPMLRPTVFVLVMALITTSGVVVIAPKAVSAAPVAGHVVNDFGDGPDAVVDGTCEATPGGGDCTLRAAIDEANAAAVATRITFAASGTIRVGSPLVVDAPVEIDGVGRRVGLSSRISGDSPPSSQLFRFVSSTSRFAVANLTLADGLGGPAGGGAIEAVAPAAGSTVANVTFVGNRSAAPGGAVAVLGGELTIQNSTFAFNSSDASGADIVDHGATSILYSTFDEGWGATSSIESTGATSLGSSIVSYWGGTACAGTITGTANLDRDGTCPGSSPLGTLGSFADHGGPVDTFDIGHASFAVDRGDPAQCAQVGGVDARGTTRPSGDACDIGAYEYTGPPAASSVEVTTAPNPSDLGESVVVTATVGSTTETLAGTGDVTFSSGGVDLATVPLVDGVAQYTATSLTSGSHTFAVVFPGDGVLPAAAGSVEHEVATPTSTVVVGITPATSDLGEAVTLTATVQGAGAVATPTGAVTFLDGTTVLDTVTLADGVASTNLSTLGIGEHTINVTYPGDAVYPSASGSATHAVAVPATTVEVTTDPSPSRIGQSVTLTATVSAPGVAQVPTGQVTFRDGSTDLGTAPLTGGTATLSVDTLAAGTRTIHGDYAGDGVFPAASGVVEHDVQAPSVVEITGPDASVSGESVTFTVTVRSEPGLTPDGEVTIDDGGTEVFRGALGTDGTAEFTTTSLAVGTSHLRAAYEGDRVVLAGTSAVFDHAVARAATSVDLGASPEQSAVGEQVTFTASVTVDAPGSGPVTGTVTFSAGTEVVGTAPVDADGVATFAISDLPVGRSVITAAYGGDGSNRGSEDLLTHEVFQARTTASLVSSLAPSRLGEQVTLTATVEVEAPGVGTPTGAVDFVDDGRVLATATLDASGEAVVTIDDLTVGSHDIVARYEGTAEFMTSESAVLEQTVERWASTLEVTPSVTTSVTGQEVTFTATVEGGSASGFTPSGTVTFDRFGLDEPVVVPLDEATGTATITLASPLGTGGSVSLTAHYGGNAAFTGSTDATGVVVEAAPVRVALTAEPANPVYGQSVTVTATVTPVSPGSGVPRGDFEILDRGVSIRGPVDRTGTMVATFTTPGDLGAWPHELTARFNGGRGWQDAESAVLPVDVVPAPTALVVDVDPSPSVVGRPVTITATMTVPDGASPPIGEPVTFDDGTDVIGSAPLRIVGDRFEASLTTTFESVGEHRLRARFAGPNHEPSTSPVVEHVVAALPTAVSIGSNSPTLPGDPIEVTVLVNNLGGAASPTGRVALEWNGRVIDGPVALSPAGAGAAVATFRPVADFGVGNHELTARYLPTGVFAPGTATHTHVVAAALSKVALDVGSGTVQWGRDLTVSVDVAAVDPADPGSASGTVRISDGAGTSCVAAAPSGSCTLDWDTPGPRRLVASYEGDARYGPSESIGRDITVGRRPSRVALEVTPDPPVAGEPARVHWTVTGHDGGAVSATIAGADCVAGPSGTCTGVYPSTAAGSPQRVTVAFAGDRRYLPSSVVRSVTPLGCHRLDLGGISPAEGTIAAVTPGNCNDGQGYIEGTTVRVQIDPATDPASRPIGVDWEGIGFTESFSLQITVGVGALRRTSLRASLRRQWNCFTVDWVDSALVDGGAGALQLDATPNCPVDTAGRAVTPGWERSGDLRRGRFLGGTTITTTPDPGHGSEFYGYTFDDTREAVRTIVVDDDVAIQGSFGPTCFDFRLAAQGPGTAKASAANCHNRFTGVDGFTAGSVVDIAVRPEVGAYIHRWDGAIDAPATPDDVWDSEVGELVREWTTTATIHDASRVQAVTAVIESCSRIEIDPLSWAGATGRVTRFRPGDCPTDDDPALYRRGRTVTVGAVPVSGEFGRWRESDDESDAEPVIEVSTDADKVLRPSFIPSRDGCVQVEARVAPGAEALVSTRGAESNNFCLPGTLTEGPAEALSGQRYRDGLSFIGTATQGDPLLGWSFTTDWAEGGRRTVAGAVATPTMPAGGTLDAELDACVAVLPEVELVYPDGRSETGWAPEGFVRPADLDADLPDCGFQAGGGAWKVGSSATLAPFVTDAFRFDHWEGDVDATPDPDDLLEVTFDGSQPTLTVRAVYEVQCADLTVRDPSRTEVAPAPNCHPGDASASEGPGGSYIVGTDVFLRGTMPGNFRPQSAARASDDHVWQGWVGDVDGDRFRNPMMINLDRDRTIGFSYRDTTVWEDIEGAFVDLGNYTSELIRKSGGVAMMLAGKFFMGAGPVGAVSMLTGVLGGVNALLEAVGVDTADFGAFVGHAEETLAWIGSSYTCIGTWALDDGGSSTYDQTLDTDADAAFKRVVASKGGMAALTTATQKGFEARAPKGIRTTNIAGDFAKSRKAMQHSLKLNKGAAALGMADGALTVLSVGVDIYDIASAGGANWAENPSAAWSDPDVLVDCMEDFMPDYLGIDTGSEPG